MDEYSLDKRIFEIAYEIAVKGYTFTNGVQKLNDEVRSKLIVAVAQIEERV
tara:strand:- start:1767 stop:1919 length:153 start_codon:yes stop_codon:yes gene_type:complete